MHLINVGPLLLMVILGLFTLVSGVEGLSAIYCSSQNTGSDYHEVTNRYNSNGACFTNCRNNYAFAIVQGSGCWCSNYIPAETTSGDDCNQGCPGYPQELCGSVDEGLFGYIPLNRAPSGTAGSSSPTSSPSGSEDSSSQASPSTSQSTTFETSTTSDTSTTSSAAPTSSWSATPITSLITVTGKVQTVTITPTAPPEPERQLPSSSWSTGKIAGVAVGISAIVAILLSLGFFAWYRHRQRRLALPPVYKDDDESPQRHPSRTSQMSLMGNSRSLFGEKLLPTIQTSGLDGIPFANNSRSPEISSPSSKRASYPRLHDQRLDPNVLWAGLDNSSRVSVPSLADEQDYSRRVLRVTNADPHHHDVSLT